MSPDWITTAFCVVLAVSLFANSVGVLWSAYRELHIRHLSDTNVKVLDTAVEALKEIQKGLAGLCKRIDEDRTINHDARIEISNNIENTGQHIVTVLQMLVKSGGVTVTNMNSDGQGQIGENSGGVHRHG